MSHMPTGRMFHVLHNQNDGSILSHESQVLSAENLSALDRTLKIADGARSVTFAEKRLETYIQECGLVVRGSSPSAGS
jgi:hypothetical protein